MYTKPYLLSLHSLNELRLLTSPEPKVSALPASTLANMRGIITSSTEVITVGAVTAVMRTHGTLAVLLKFLDYITPLGYFAKHTDNKRSGAVVSVRGS